MTYSGYANIFQSSRSGPIIRLFGTAGLATVLSLCGAPTARAETPPLIQATDQIFVDSTVAFPAQPGSATPTPAMLTEITTWLSQNFDLPAPKALPKIAFARPEAIAAIHHRDLAKDQPLAATDNRAVASQSEIVAVYDPVMQTIYLPQGWRNDRPADMSVLVHEMVHHLQNDDSHKHGCPAEREKLAFEAQERWLERFGRSLASEFELDGFTLLVRTSCGF